ncbi:hypothetical protein PUN28_017106 [Cardiocondyla obscurior]|uniref:Uncharacterized protein n=1 Tax=Cardiocondyla obscurior TaxID=286306 RepID=A0AAW2EN20_9HYME
MPVCAGNDYRPKSFPQLVFNAACVYIAPVFPDRSQTSRRVSTRRRKSKRSPTPSPSPSANSFFFGALLRVDHFGSRPGNSFAIARYRGDLTLARGANILNYTYRVSLKVPRERGETEWIELAKAASHVRDSTGPGECKLISNPFKVSPIYGSDISRKINSDVNLSDYVRELDRYTERQGKEVQRERETSVRALRVYARVYTRAVLTKHGEGWDE